jgi:hypothetical protein
VGSWSTLAALGAVAAASAAAYRTRARWWTALRGAPAKKTGYFGTAPDNAYGGGGGGARSSVESLLALRQTYCVRCLYVLLGVGAVAGVLVARGDRSAYLSDTVTPTYARAGEDAVHFNVSSRKISCRELRRGALSYDDASAAATTTDATAGQPLPMRTLSLTRLRHYAEYMLLHSPQRPACTCAPMFGARRRHVAVMQRVENIVEAVLHMYNPRLDEAWFAAWGGMEAGDVASGGGGGVSGRHALVREDQRMLFPARTERVKVVRANGVRVVFVNESCAGNAIVLLKESAWCVQACLDLLDGISVYDRGAASAGNVM